MTILRFGVLAVRTLAIVGLGFGGVAEAVPVCMTGGSCYETSTNLGLPNNTWLGAQAAAAAASFNGQPGHLATLTSAAEQSFIDSNFGTFINNSLPNGPWIGLFQLPTGVEPGSPAQGAAGGWQWVTGEPFYSGTTNTAADVIFHNWLTIAPNNAPPLDEDFGHLPILTGEPVGRWNDAPGVSLFPSLVEFEPIPEPATLLLFGTTAAGLGLARWRQRRRGKQQP